MLRELDIPQPTLENTGKKITTETLLYIWYGFRCNVRTNFIVQKEHPDDLSKLFEFSNAVQNATQDYNFINCLVFSGEKDISLE